MENDVYMLISGYLVAVSWQAVVLFLAAYAIERLTRNAQPIFHYWLWTLLLVRALIPFDTSSLTAPVRQAGSAIVDSLTPETVSATVHEVGLGVQLLGRAAQEHIMQPVLRDAADKVGLISFTVWNVVFVTLTLIILARLLYYRMKLKQYAEISDPDITGTIDRLRMELGIRRPVKAFLVQDERITSPAVSGLVNPSIFLPVFFVNDLEHGEREPILLHELVHIKRRDPLVNFVQIIVQAVFFFHPVVWRMNSAIRDYREEVCDDIAIEKYHGMRKQYSHSYIRFMELQNSNLLKVGAVGFSEHRGTIAHRLLRIADQRYKHFSPMKKTSLAFLCLVLASSLALSSTWTNITSSDLMDEGEATIEVIITGPGKYMVNGQACDIHLLRDALETAVSDFGPNRTVYCLIGCEDDTEITYQEVKYVTALAVESGADGLGILE